MEQWEKTIENLKSQGKKIPSQKQLNNIIDTFRKNDVDLYKDIIMLADEIGIATKQAFKSSSQAKNRIWISQAKRNTKKSQELYAKIYEIYGTSYTDYINNKVKPKYKKYKNDVLWRGEQPLSMKDYQKARKYLNDMYSELFKNLDSKTARTILEITEDKFFQGSDKESIEYIDRQTKYYESQGVKFDKLPKNPF